MQTSHFISTLKAELTKPLPGSEAQRKMSNAIRKVDQIVPDDARIACVMALLYEKNDVWHIALIERIKTKKDKHSGQIGFPGGTLEKTDANLAAGALRETEEEIGVPVSAIEILGAITPLYIPVSNFMVHPFIGYTSEVPVFKAQESEVSSILEVSINHLLDPVNTQVTNVNVRDNLTIKNVPFYNVQGHIVWGATAMMLSEFLVLIQNVLEATQKKV